MEDKQDYSIRSDSFVSDTSRVEFRDFEQRKADAELDNFSLENNLYDTGDC